MELGSIVAALNVGMTLTELGQKLYNLIGSAKGQGVESKILLYLLVAQTAIRALGRERQGIVSDATGCDVQDLEQVEALSKRMREYLQEDNVREPLKKAIEGLRGCRPDIELAAEGVRWRKRDKQKAVQDFLSTLENLDAQAKDLEQDYFPGYSGQGLGTLMPVRDLG